MKVVRFAVRCGSQWVCGSSNHFLSLLAMDRALFRTPEAARKALRALTSERDRKACSVFLTKVTLKKNRDD